MLVREIKSSAADAHRPQSSGESGHSLDIASIGHAEENALCHHDL